MNWYRRKIAREDAAREALELFSPLANRLGVWQLKWELEDLAFRCLEPETYRDLARELDEKRKDRETYIGEVIRILRIELEAAGIVAEVSGRPKHIYSIWRKMQRKGVGLDDLFDVRAVRVMVDDVKDCYAVLGIVHNLWTPIPREFDDYIARPKANDYRSLHTAVVGPDSRVLEVQVRTHDMHQHAELGVAAHWRYKEAVKGDPRLDDKISWLRNVLEWKDELADARRTGGIFQDRPVPGHGLRGDAAGAGGRLAARVHSGGFRLSPPLGTWASLSRRKGQWPDRSADLCAVKWAAGGNHCGQGRRDLRATG